MYQTYSKNVHPRYVSMAGPHNIKHLRPIVSYSTKRRPLSAISDGIPNSDQYLIPWSTAEISIPGMRQLKNPNYNKYGKIFWFLAITISASLCIQQVSRRCHRYIHSPIGFKVELSRQDYIDFPAFTICTSNATVFNVLAENYTYTKYNFSEIMRNRVSIMQLWEILNVGEENINLTDTCPKQRCFYKQTIATYRGNCVTIHSPKPVFHVGAKTGFSVVIKKRHDIVPNVDETLITIYCHENNWTPVNFIYYDTSIYHSHITTISITRRQFTYLNTEEKPCTTTNGTGDCWRKCLERDMRSIAETNCRLPSMLPDGDSLCQTPEEVNKTHFALIERFKHREGWQCTCPRRCSEVLFNLIQDVVKPDDKGNTILNIYVPDDSVDSLTEVYNYSFIQLLCDLGGTLGLFLGFCVLTLLELIEVTFDFIKLKLFPNRQIIRPR